MRLEDFRSTLTEIVDAEHHGVEPRDVKELDPETYGRRAGPDDLNLSTIQTETVDPAPSSDRQSKRTINFHFANMASFRHSGPLFAVPHTQGLSEIDEAANASLIKPRVESNFDSPNNRSHQTDNLQQGLNQRGKIAALNKMLRVDNNASQKYAKVQDHSTTL